MKTFDAPSRETCTTRRSRTSTPLQALALLNDVTYIEAARSLARSMVESGGSTGDEHLRHGFRRVLTRSPSSKEMVALRSALHRYMRIYRNDTDAAQEFAAGVGTESHDELNPVEFAAYSAVACILFNLDETITRE